MSAAISLHRPAFTDAVLVEGDSMEPAIRSGSVAFLMPAGYPLFDGICAIDTGGAWGLYRLTLAGSTVLLSADNPKHGRYELDRATFLADRPRMVAGIATPYTSEFRAFLRDRFVSPGA